MGITDEWGIRSAVHIRRIRYTLTVTLIDYLPSHAPLRLKQAGARIRNDGGKKHKFILAMRQTDAIRRTSGKWFLWKNDQQQAFQKTFSQSSPQQGQKVVINQMFFLHFKLLVLRRVQKNITQSPKNICNRRRRDNKTAPICIKTNLLSIIRKKYSMLSNERTSVL